MGDHPHSVACSLKGTGFIQLVCWRDTRYLIAVVGFTPNFETIELVLIEERVHEKPEAKPRLKTHQNSEKYMSTLSSRVLAAFRNMAVTIESSDFEGSTRMGKLFKAAQEQQRKDSEKALVGELTQVSAALESAREQIALKIASHEAAIADLRAEGAALTAAFNFGEDGGNYLPLLNGLGMVSVDDYRVVGCSRADWEGLLTIPEPAADEPAAG